MDEILIQLEGKIEELVSKIREYKGYKEKCEQLEKENAELREKLDTVQQKIENLLEKMKDVEV